MGRSKLLLVWFAIALSSISVCFAAEGTPSPWAETERNINLRYPEIPKIALARAFAFLASHEQAVTNKNFLTLIDFDQPSTAERMYVIDLQTEEASSYLVAHGKNSGENYAGKFSNIPETKMSSLGAYLTGAEYIGQHGLSMILKGQDPTNDNAERRSIVMHPAEYVSYDYIQSYGRLGRSWGCPAVSPKVSEELIHKLKGGSVLYIYHSLLNGLEG